MREFELNQCTQEVAVPRKPFGELTNRRYPLRRLEGDSDRADGRACFPESAVAVGPSTSRLRTALVNRRVVSDPVHRAEERRKFLDPIKEAENESASEERPGTRPRVRFRSKSATTVPLPFFQARGDIPNSDFNDRVEDPSPDSSFSILGAPAEGEMSEGMDDRTTTEGLLGDFEEASHSPPPPSTLRQAASNRSARQVIDTLVPESHSTPATIRSNAVLRGVSLHPIHLSPSEPPCHPFDDPYPKGTEIPRPKPFNTSFLPPQTHKVTRGQLVVLPSRTLLVDFREGERRQGRQGAEVLTISPEGEEVKIHPHVTVISN